MGCGFLASPFVTLVTLVDSAVLERPSRATRRRELKRERDRRHRERIRAHRFTVTIELGERELDWLISIHWITAQEADSGNRKAIGIGVTAGIAASAKG
jgi:hypothetical protein